MLQGAAGSGPERHGADHPAFGGLSIFLVFCFLRLGEWECQLQWHPTRSPLFGKLCGTNCDNIHHFVFALLARWSWVVGMSTFLCENHPLFFTLFLLTWLLLLFVAYPMAVCFQEIVISPEGAEGRGVACLEFNSQLV